MEKAKLVTAEELQLRVSEAIRTLDEESPNLDKLRVLGTLTGRMLKSVSLDIEFAKRVGRPPFARTQEHMGVND